MDKKLYVVLSNCEADGCAERRDLENVEGGTFDNIEAVIEAVEGEITYMPMIEFSTLFNDDETLSCNHFFSFVYLKK